MDFLLVIYSLELGIRFVFSFLEDLVEAKIPMRLKLIFFCKYNARVAFYF